MKIKVKVGSIRINGKSYKRGEVVELDEKIVEKMDKRDYEVVEEKMKRRYDKDNKR